MRSLVARLTPAVLVAWIVLAALVPRLSPLRPVYLVNTYLLLPALFGAALLDCVLRSRRRWALRVRVSDAGLALFGLVAVASIALQHDPGAVVRQNLADLWRTFVVPVAAFWAIRLTRPREKGLASWAVPLAALCAIELAVGLLAWLDPPALPSFWPGSIQETGGVRITGTLPQPDLYAAVMVFCATTLANLGAGAASRLTRSLAGGGIALAFTGVFLSFSRASWLGGLLALAILVANYGRKLAVPCVVIVLAVVGLSRVHEGTARLPASGPATAAPARENESYATTRLTMTWTIRDRIVLDVAGLKMFLRRPLLGWGFGSYDRHAHEFVAKVGPFVPTEWDKNEAASHCTHLSILAEMGVLGYGLLALPAARLVGAMVHRRKTLWRDRPLVGLWAIAIFLAVVSLLVDLRYVALSLGLGGLVLGLIAVRVDADEPER
ncbi:MAG: O-antigen ligase family protein [Thermoanaerobaculales bacterium]